MCVALLAMLCGLEVSAQEPVVPVTVVNINTKDGGVTHYRLPSKPVITMVDDKMVVSAAELEDLELLRAEVSHIDFALDWSGSVDAAGLADNEFVFSFVDNTTVQMASPRLNRADLFDVAGHKLASVATADGNLTISLADLPAGVYVVAPDCHPAVKIVRK